MTIEQNDPTLPTFRRAELVEIAPALELIADLTAGPRQMWKKSRKYLEQWKNEDDRVYDIRRFGEACFGGFGRTVSAGVGMLWGDEPAIVWAANEERMRVLWDNIDAAGTKGTVFGARFSSHALEAGLALILIDHPAAPKNAAGERVLITAANEEAYGLRPTWSLYHRRHLNSWRVEVLNNRATVTQLVLEEEATVADGEYGVAPVRRFRVLSLVGGVASFRVLEERKKRGGKVVYEEVDRGVFTNRNGETATALPIAVAYAGGKRAEFVAPIPLEGLAYANLGYWQYATDLKFNRRVSAFEQFVVTGELQRSPATPDEPAELRIGPLVAVYLQQGGSATWEGPSGKGLVQLENGQKEKMVEMDQLGLGFLVPKKSAQMTATEADIDSFAQKATLRTAGAAIADAINVAWEWSGWYLGIEKKDVPTLAIDTEFDGSKMDAGTINAYVALVKAGFPKRAALEALQDGGRIPEEQDLDALELEWEANLSAASALGQPPNPDDETNDEQDDDEELPGGE